MGVYVNFNHPKHKIMFRVIFAILIVALAVTIFLMSEQNGENSSETSGKITRKIADAVVPSYREKTPIEQNLIVETMQFYVRKTAHFLIFALLGILTSLFCASFPLTTLKYFLFSQLFCTAYAVSDELHQLSSVGRSGEIRDVILDSLGSLVGIAFVFFCIKLIYFFRKRRKENA